MLTNLLLLALTALAALNAYLLWRLLTAPKPREVGTPCGFVPQSPCEATACEAQACAAQPCAATPCHAQPLDLSDVTKALALVRADLKALATRPQPAPSPVRRGVAPQTEDLGEIRKFLLAKQERRNKRREAKA
jgi:hypothetical protein